MKRSPMPRRRKPIRKISAKRRVERAAAQPVVDAVLDRDRGCVLWRHSAVSPCWGPLDPHHLRKDGQGGAWTLENLVTLCRRHNDWVELEPDRAYALGLVVRRGETTADAWRRMAAAGLPVDGKEAA